MCDSNPDGNLETVVETIVVRVFNRLKGGLMTSVTEALKGFRVAFDERMRAMEDTCKELVEHADS